jgi:hypothetical protein
MKKALRYLGRVGWMCLKAFVLVVVVSSVLLLGGNGLLMVLPRSPEPPTPVEAGTFAALGDAPYSRLETVLFEVVLEDVAAHDLVSVIHVGDIFSEPCRDDAYRRTLGVFDAVPHPVVYTPGDNEWTDCFDGTEESEPYDRLASIRDIFFVDPSNSLGGRRMGLSHQGEDLEHEEFIENARWTHGPIVFATVHLVGTSNGTRPFPGRTDVEAQEPLRRSEAAAAWVRGTFAYAAEVQAEAVVIAFHANVYFEDTSRERRRRPFEPFLQTLEEEVARFEKPVLGIHGDFHDFIVDRPLVDRSTSESLANFTRLQVPGSPAVGWVRISVTPGEEELFHFESRVAPYWPW